MLTAQDIAGRIKLGQNFCRKFVLLDRQASARFRDASNRPMFTPDPTDDSLSEDEDGEGGDVPFEVSVGQPNNLTTNLLVKNAAIAIGDPDFNVTSENPDNAKVVREFLRAKWRLYNWVRLSRRVLLKHDLVGLGILAYRWDKKKRSCFEFVHSWDLAIDPHVIDFTDLRWAARRIKMPVREAAKKYGASKFSIKEDTLLDKEKVAIWLYYDQEEEVHIFDGKELLRTENRYGTVPILFYEGDIDPGPSVWPLGDAQLAAGLQAELSDLTQIISNRAKHGGPLNLVDVGALGKGGQEALENGQQQGFIPIRDIVTPPVIRVPGEELSPTLLEAKRTAQNAMDSITGVSQYQRGVVEQRANFATEVATLTQQSGARAIMAQKEFERLVSRMAEIVVMLEQAFGGPTPDVSTDEETLLWEAFQDVQEVRVIEASTVYKDPTFEVQQSLQLLNTIAQLVPIFAQTGGQIPNLEQYVNDLLRATGKHDMARYWMAAPMLPPQPVPDGSGASPLQ